MEESKTKEEKTINVDELEDRVLVNISNALYDDSVGKITLNGKTFPVKRHKKGMRYVQIGGVTFMQQNRFKGTQYARMIAEGHEITWGIRDGNWIRIMDGEVKR